MTKYKVFLRDGNYVSYDCFPLYHDNEIAVMIIDNYIFKFSRPNGLFEFRLL